MIHTSASLFLNALAGSHTPVFVSLFLVMLLYACACVHDWMDRSRMRPTRVLHQPCRGARLYRPTCIANACPVVHDRKHGRITPEGLHLGAGSTRESGASVLHSPVELVRKILR